MNVIYENTHQVNLMLWETDPQKRKLNKKVNLVSAKELKAGDRVIGNYGSEFCSVWTIEEVIEQRDSSIKGNTYFVTTCTWGQVRPQSLQNDDLSNCSKTLQKFIKGNI